MSANLRFMEASGLAANASKTNFVVFGRRSEPSIKVGQASVEEQGEETLLGITFSKHLTWKAHIDKLRPELLKRIGILKRLSSKLPRHIMCQMIEPIFTAKARYALELLVDATEEKNMPLKHLHRLHRSAIKAALRIPALQHPSDKELYRQSGQMSIRKMAWEATALLAWKCSRDWENHPLTRGRIEKHVSGRQTRQATQRSFPPQSTKDSLVGRLVEVWESLPDHVKLLNKLEEVKCQIKDLAIC